jgi:hypothetical protein
MLAYLAPAIVLCACDLSPNDRSGTTIHTTPPAKKQIVNDPPDNEMPGGLIADYSEAREVCSHRNPWRNAYFGDLHIHTALSMDAYQQDVRTMPEDAYDFARGKEIPFHGTVARIDRPLDFAAVTDHSEYLGDLWRCTSKEDPMHGSKVCDLVRQGSGAAFQVLEKAFEAEKTGTRAERVTRALKILFLSEDPKRNTNLCGEQGKSCAAAEQNGWRKIRNAAELAYDRSAECRFTTFVGYEYSGVKTGSNYHRNIIFRNANVPSSPVSYLDAPQDHMLWRNLGESCLAGVTGCDYLSIPHNSNLSNGKLLTPDYSSAQSTAAEIELAALRQKSEPLMEIFQHKGQSECINGIGGMDSAPDELCEFEQVRQIGGTTTVLEAELLTEECNGSPGDGGMIDTGCVSRNDYLRGALLTGLDERQRLGVNPLKLGVIASTDTHESTPGAVDEQSWQGHVGREASLSWRLQKKVGLPYRLDGSPGGLAGVWAVENSRDALYNAMKRRETFGTSGPRIQPRFFAGWSYQPNMCEDHDLIESAYKGGVPMGGDFTHPPKADIKPRFIAAAVRDPEGNLLQRLQIIKGWIDAEGGAHVEVIDVAGDADNGAGVDLNTGESRGPGFASLCTVYVDEKFKADQAAYYYLRVVENPSLRWSWAQCIALEEERRPAECINDAPKTIQELAWSSPIWYEPEGG